MMKKHKSSVLEQPAPLTQPQTRAPQASHASRVSFAPLAVLTLAVLALFPSCKKQEEARLRSEYIKVYSYDVFNREVEVNNVQVPFEGVKGGKLTIDTNLDDFDWRYQISQNEEHRDWFRITSVDSDSLGRMVMTYDADSILELNTLERREGKLSFSCPDVYLGKYVTICQGYVLRWSQDFKDYPYGRMTLYGGLVYETDYIHVINTDYYDYISFNAYAESDNEFSEKNITIDVKILGGPSFFAIERASFKVNVPLGKYSSSDNLHYMIMYNGGEIMGSKIKLQFSVDNDEGVTVYLDNLNVYKVSEAELMDLSDDEEFDESEEWD